MARLPHLLVAVLLLLPGLGTAEPVTAALTIAASRSAVSDVLDQARANAQTVLADAAIHANGVIDRVEKLLGENVRKPIEELNETARNALSSMEFTVASLQATANSLPKCVGNEADIAMAGLKSGLLTAMNQIPTVGGPPIGYLLQQPSTRAPYTVVRDPAKTVPLSLILRGANLWPQEEVCASKASVRRVGERQARAGLGIESMDPEKVVLALQPGLPDGEWLAEVTVERRRTLLGCLAPRTESVAASFMVTRPLSANVRPTVTPFCAGYTECRKSFNGSCTNGSTRRDNNCVATITFDEPGCEYLRLEDWSRGGRSGTVSAPQRAGNSLIIRSTADRRSRTEGGTSRQVFSGVMIGRRPAAAQRQPRQEIPLAVAVARGHSVPYELAWVAPDSCEVYSWVLGGTARFSDGKVVALPERSTTPDREVSTTAGGIRISLNTQTRRGTVEIAEGGCL